jgi:hypothetical protein
MPAGEPVTVGLVGEPTKAIMQAKVCGIGSS